MAHYRSLRFRKFHELVIDQITRILSFGELPKHSTTLEVSIAIPKKMKYMPQNNERDNTK